MKQTKHKKETKKKSALSGILKAELISTAITLLLIFIVSYLLWQGVLGISSISIINTVIKAIGALSAALLTSLCIREKRIIFCPVSGIIYIILSHIILACFLGQFTVTPAILSDLLIGIGAGLTIGIITAGKN